MNIDLPRLASARPKRIGRFVTGLLACLFLPLASLAQNAAAGSGTITGRVLNPATGEYIRNAEIAIQGTRQVAVSEDGGYYHFDNAPAGEVTLVATYTGHEMVTAAVN